jgi:hypothetical protein
MGSYVQHFSTIVCLIHEETSGFKETNTKVLIQWRQGRRRFQEVHLYNVNK